MRKVDYLLLVSDPSLRGIRVAEMICNAAQKTYGKLPCGLLINRTHENEPTDFEQKTDLKIVGEVPEDDSVRRLDTAGRPYFELSDGPAQTAVIRALQSIGFF
jgi:CO dehydrogenase maturation factor